MIPSKRTYIVIVSTNELPKASAQEIGINEILNPKDEGGDWEYIYALEEVIDKVLDLQKMDILEFQANRDDAGTRGILIRLS